MKHEVCSEQRSKTFLYVCQDISHLAHGRQVWTHLFLSSHVAPGGRGKFGQSSMASCFLYCTPRPFTVLHWTALHCTALHCHALQCTELHRTSLHWNAICFNDIIVRFSISWSPKSLSPLHFKLLLFICPECCQYIVKSQYLLPMYSSYLYLHFSSTPASPHFHPPTPVPTSLYLSLLLNSAPWSNWRQWNRLKCLTSSTAGARKEGSRFPVWCFQGKCYQDAAPCHHTTGMNGAFCDHNTCFTINTPPPSMRNDLSLYIIIICL